MRIKVWLRGCRETPQRVSDRFNRRTCSLSFKPDTRHRDDLRQTLLENNLVRVETQKRRKSPNPITGKSRRDEDEQVFEVWSSDDSAARRKDSGGKGIFCFKWKLGFRRAFLRVHRIGLKQQTWLTWTEGLISDLPSIKCLFFLPWKKLRTL